jgi:hypothetical protein
MYSDVGLRFAGRLAIVATIILDGFWHLLRFGTYLERFQL